MTNEIESGEIKVGGLTEEELEKVAEIMEAHMHDRVEARKAGKKVHWGRRTVLVVIVLIVGCGTHYILEIPGLSIMAQSFELILASMIDSIYARVKE